MNRRLRARIRRTFVPSIGVRALERWAATRPKGSVQIATLHGPKSDEPVADISIQDARLWVDGPARWRYEVDTPGHGTAISVTDPPLWWSYAPSGHAISNENDPIQYPAQTEHPESQLFHAEALLRGLTITGTRPERRDGRDLAVVTAVAQGDVATGLTPGAESYELVVDRGADLALRVAARAEGVEYMVVEIIELELDVPMPAELFRVTLPPGLAFAPPPVFRPRSRLARLVERFPLRWRGLGIT